MSRFLPPVPASLPDPVDHVSATATVYRGDEARIAPPWR
jgi:hypothetical protein